MSASQNKARPAKKDNTASASPVARVKHWPVSAAVFADKRTAKNGKEYTTYSVDLRRTYRKSDGQYGNTHTLRRGDVASAIVALQECNTRINELATAK